MEVVKLPLFKATPRLHFQVVKKNNAHFNLMSVLLDLPVLDFTLELKKTLVFSECLTFYSSVSSHFVVLWLSDSLVLSVCTTC